MAEKIVIPSETMEKEPPKKAIMPVMPTSTPDELRNELLQFLKKYPYYAFFLYSDMNPDIAEFVRLQGGLLHNLSGDDCLVSVIENPTQWDETWVTYWKERLGDNYSAMSEKWLTLKPFHRNLAYQIAREFDVHYDLFPCIFLFTSVESKEGLVIPIVVSKENYLKFFEEFFRILHDSLKANPESPLPEFRKSYRGFWIKWVLSKKVKTGLETFNEWGSIIIKTQKTIIDILAPIKSLLTPVA